jgi:hypothetical protein
MNEEELLSHDNIIKIIKIFGLEIETDYWDIVNKRSMRLVSNDWIYDFNHKGHLTIYKDDGYELILDKLKSSLIQTGKNLKTREIRRSLDIK